MPHPDTSTMVVAEVVQRVVTANEIVPVRLNTPIPPIRFAPTSAFRQRILNPTLPFRAPPHVTQSIPNISIRDYLVRILKYCPNTPNEVFIAILVHLDRMALRSIVGPAGYPFVPHSLNIHRLIIAAVSVCSKFYSDTYYSTARYAKVVGGICKDELLKHELDFTLLTDFELAIPSYVLDRYALAIINFNCNLAVPFVN
ncbi:cyclin-related 2 [Sistotremastrum suecicum HHB10207 ss-3]|uniref:Cyclin-related 2 n=1 Tax=Sistotremastrum suecicum HHB10207 ss-3 TaxID=1314776 RepID=A0A165WUZ6_9AGAM|nr:cyclin-related 2 [Sistotremastrum suecicum HHB10207 ss-3]